MATEENKLPAIDRPCPDCGSRNVDWRRRRWYDGLFKFLEGLLLIGGTRHTNGGGVTHATSATFSNFAIGHPHFHQLPLRQRRSFDEPETESNRRAADLLYRCRQCGGKGEVFTKRRYRLLRR